MHNLKQKTLRGQTVHWIGAQFCVCMFLDSRDKSLNMFKFVGTIKENERTKEDQRERPCRGIRKFNAQNAQFGLVMNFQKISDSIKKF